MKSLRSCEVHLDSSGQNYMNLKVTVLLFGIDVPFDRIISIVIPVSVDLKQGKKKRHVNCIS